MVKGLEDDLNLLLEQLAVGIGILHRRAEGLDFPCVVAAPNPEDCASFGQNVGHSEVLGQTQWVPHWSNVEPAAYAQAFRHMRQMHGEHQDVGNAFIAFMLEMMLGEPKRVEAQRIHRLGDSLRLLEHGSQLLIGVAALVSGRRILAHVGEIDMTGINGNELGDHFSLPLSSRTFHRAQFATTPGTARGLASPGTQGLFPYIWRWRPPSRLFSKPLAVRKLAL